MTRKPTIVFAPGAWHSPDSFRLVRNALQARGWETDAVTYPSVGAEPPTKGIPDDAAALRNVLDDLANQGKQIVLVVHSYGGLVGANAVPGLGYEQRQKEGKAGGIVTFLYLAAFVTPVGQSILKLLGGRWLPWMRVEGSYVFADTPEEVFYHDVPLDLQKEAAAALTHECVRAWTDEVDYEPWHDMHCLYFVCEEDRAVPAAVQEQMAQILGPDSVIFRSRTSHSPFLSAVQDVVDGVEKAAHSGQMRVQL
ncbi:Alpha/beta hydrolase fold-1 [Fusarium redolens]|uniref:Alpha/beta hydrolase fold-1 n=1 Tax=Fusarium redolens TaxID=48865 RepID=A0A9P9JWG7_FUSRE|nr:Alpha/beta hydrolase fold-1 [Fusarium redolens]KAH7231344.1 Alpha/beta hydrolase fold-1 [Fusarium redolens]